MFKHLGRFSVLAVCFFVMLISGCPDGGVRDIVSPPVAEPIEEDSGPVTVPSVLIYTGDTSWITPAAAKAEAETTINLLRAAGISARVTEDEDSVREWMLQTASDSRVNVLILYGILPPSIYPEGNTQPDGSVAEQWIETFDGNTLLNHGDYFGFNRFANGEGALQNLMDTPGISIPLIDHRQLPMKVDPTGAALTPSLVDFGSDRPLQLNQLQDGWVSERILAIHIDDEGRLIGADPVVIRDRNRGRIALLYQTQDQDDPKGEVAAELIINYLLSQEDPLQVVSVDPPDGSTIPIDATITVTFNHAPKGQILALLGRVPRPIISWGEDLGSNGNVVPNGNTVTITGYRPGWYSSGKTSFRAGPLSVGIGLSGGLGKLEGEPLAALNYIVGEPIPEGMVVIPYGGFERGSEDAEARDNEKPVHKIQIFPSFYMDKYEVTNAQFKAFVDANPAWQKGNIEGRHHNGNYLDHWSGNDYPAGKADHPVVFVSWYAAMAYANWAGKRLPTEAEWEYAARGGLGRQKYPWGNTISPADANYDGNVGDTTPVGRYAANGYGLYDMAGNVWEWCLDAGHEFAYDQLGRGRNPLFGLDTIQELRENFTAKVHSKRVLRGGAWNSSDAQRLRVAFRVTNAPPSLAYLDVGFRCVKDPAP